MKTKIIIALVAIVGTLGLTGCKPKTTTLTGQVFIATQSGDNVKLGDVEILLIEKSQVTDFLEKREPIIESEIASRQQTFEVAKNDVQKAQADYDLFEANKPDIRKEDHKTFLASNFFSTYPDIGKIKSQIESLRQQSAFLSKQSDILQAQRDQAEQHGDFPTSDNLLVQQDALSWRSLDLIEEANSKIDKLQDFVNQVESEKENNLNSAKTREIDAAASLRNSPAVEDYIADFSPTVVQRTLSDADGKFSFVYPRNESFTIYARAQRMTLNGTEKYYWLIDAPAHAETLQVFLSNNNLIFVDPDGYFKLKPKETPTIKVSAL